MSEIKVNLSIILKGRVMLSESDAKAQNAYTPDTSTGGQTR